MLKGIDISNHQQGFDIPTDIDFAFFKATEGTGFVDWTCNGFVQQAKDKNLLWGFYHFAKGLSPEIEADYFYEHTQGYYGSGLPVLDYEISNQAPSGLSPSEWVERFCKRIYQLTKVYPLVYCSARAYPYNYENLVSDWTCKHCALWLAAYPMNYTGFIEDYPQYDVTPWTLFAWQFTSSLQMNGISVDGDLAYVTRKQWQAYVTGEREKGKDMALTAKDVWAYKNTGLEKVDTYQILRDIRDDVASVKKDIAKLDKEMQELKKNH